MSDEQKSNPCELNCQGLACPQPVIMTKKALDQKPAELTVVVDNPAAKENVAKFAASRGYGVNIESTDSGFPDVCGDRRLSPCMERCRIRRYYDPRGAETH